MSELSDRSPTILVDFFEHLLSGKIFSQLKEVNDLVSADLFLLQRYDKSLAISYNDLSTSIGNDCLSSLGVKSMAYQDTWKYALSSHDHDGQYTKAIVDAYEPTTEQSALVAVISVDNEVKEIYAPVREYGYPPEPEIGTLKLVCSKKAFKRITNDDIDKEDFDGWVYPDGTTFTPFSAERFSSAIGIYGNGSTTSFTVPNLRTFFKAANAPAEDIQTVYEQTLGIAEHSHIVKPTSIDGELKVKSDFTFTTYVGQANSMPENMSHIHSGSNNKPKVAQVNFNFNLEQVTFNNLSCQPYGSPNQPDQIFEPRHNTIPVMIYIGGVLV